jgi:hypothetical protein
MPNKYQISIPNNKNLFKNFGSWNFVLAAKKLNLTGFRKFICRY